MEQSGERPIIVQKYGGSSVADLDRLGRVADKVVETHRAGHRVVVVVSAMGKTTDALLTQAREVDPEPPRRELDMLVSTGERVSMALLSIAIQKRGASAISFTGSQAGIITTDRHFDARILAIRPERIEQGLDEGKIVIVAGYQGVSERREITTLGRGGSDTTAVALAAALGAERCEIYSDVDGVYSADPRVEAGARHLPEIDPELLQNAAEAGAKVLNAQAVEWAKRAGITIYARHTGQKYVGPTPVDGAKQTLVRESALGKRAALVAIERNVAVLALVGGDAKANLARLGDACTRADLAPRDVSFGAGATLSATFPLLNAPDWARGKRVLLDTLGADASIVEGSAAVTGVGDGLTGVGAPFSPHALARLLADAPLGGLLVGPLRATVLTDDAAADALCRRMHAALVEAGRIAS